MFSPDVADTHGIAYRPREIVYFMCNSVEAALKEHFGLTLSSPEVVILDPCTGTGNFIVNLIERIPGRALQDAYANRLFANEVMLLPYYVASLNIEHAYYERMRTYESFNGLCFVDTLDMAQARQIGMFTPANTDRVERERNAAITVIIGNPPYNVGQKRRNDNNRNRKYKVVDEGIRDAYAKDSKATNKNSLSGMYVNFFRWATDRLGDRDGIVCFVSNNCFVDQHAFDAIKKRGLKPRLCYSRVPEMWRKPHKLDFLIEAQIDWQTIAPDARHSWVVLANEIEYGALLPMEYLFSTHSRGVRLGPRPALQTNKGIHRRLQRRGSSTQVKPERRLAGSIEVEQRP